MHLNEKVQPWEKVSPGTFSGFGRTVPLDNVQTVMAHV